MANNKITIYVCHHKPGYMVSDEVFRPIQVGAALSGSKLCSITDSQGTSISERNKEFCELTAIYWAWKNDLESEWIGLMHYRRYLAFAPVRVRVDIHGCANFDTLDDASAFQTGLDAEAVQRHLEFNPKLKAILPTRWSVKQGGFDSLKEHYTKSDYHYEKDLATVRDVICEKYPNFSSAFDKVMAGDSGYFTNVFVLRRDLYNNYCEWLFDILFEVERRTDLTNYSTPAKRVFGYLAERLFNVYLETINLNGDEKFELTRTFFRNTETSDSKEVNIQPLSAGGVSIAIASDDNFVPHLAALIESIKDTLSIERGLQICVLDGGISPKNKRLLSKQFKNGLRHDGHLHFIDCSHMYDNVDVHMHFSKSTFYRIDIGHLLKNHRKVIYIDCDTIVQEDLAKLWDMDLGSSAIAAAPDLIMKNFVKQRTPAMRETGGKPAGEYLRDYVGLGEAVDGYFQAGVIVFDLDRYRELGVSTPSLKELLTKKYWFLDQDVLNKFLIGKIKYIDTSWNCVNLIMDIKGGLTAEWAAKASEDLAAPKIIHYAGFEAKPWNNPAAPWSEVYWHYLRRTYWYESVALKMKAPSRDGHVIIKGLGYKLLRSVWRNLPNFAKKPMIAFSHTFNVWYFGLQK